jgi:uncharacterized alpha-E superfamily protein
MLSRVAENLYWLGRYLERADNLARLADAYTLASAEQLTVSDRVSWRAVIEALGAIEAYDAARAANPALRPEDFVIHAATYPQSVRSTINQARSLAREVREHLSREVFEEINGIYLAATDSTPDGMRDFTDIVRRGIASTIGLFDHTVLWNEGSSWFRCGIYLERADMTSRIIDSKYFVVLPEDAEIDGPLDRAQWKAVLRSASALEAFRRRHRSAVSGATVADLLLFDEEFPRSLAFAVAGLRAGFEAATRGSRMTGTVYPTREIVMLQLDLRAANIQGAIRTGLHEFLDDFQGRLIRVNNVLSDHIFQSFPDGGATTQREGTLTQ